MISRRFPQPEPTSEASQAIVAQTKALKALARAQRIARWMATGFLPECARAEQHLLDDVKALDVAMSEGGFNHLLERIDRNNLLDQMDSDAEVSEELLSHIRVRNLVLWAKYN